MFLPRPHTLLPRAATARPALSHTQFFGNSGRFVQLVTNIFSYIRRRLKHYPRRAVLQMALLLVVLAPILAACESGEVDLGEMGTVDLGSAFGSGSNIGPRTAETPLTATESYMQKYQPGPLPRVFQTTHLYDRNGILLAELYDEGRRTWVSLDKISPYLIDATIATEDESFYSNIGIDPARVVAAMWQNSQNDDIVSGASTITMQLARNLFLGPDQRYEQSIDRKIEEAGIAQELTSLYTKDEILEMYLNLLNYGHQTYGPEAASQAYFGKSAAELTMAEAAMLAGLPQQPAYLDPYINYDDARYRQSTVLDLMVRHGFLSRGEADAVYAQPIILAGDNMVRQPVRAPHFVQYVMDVVDARLGRNYTRRSGLNIISSLDLTMQEMAERVVAEKVAELSPRYGMSNAALVAMQPGTAQVLAMVGSIDFNSTEIDGQVNVAVMPRQPGSSIKPILFATAIEDNLISPATVIYDTPVTYSISPGNVYQPRNYDYQFHGPLTIRHALANSYNIPSVKLLEVMGIPRMLENARNMGLRSLNRDDSYYGLSLTLGGGEVTLMDMMTAFHVMANQGVRIDPQPFVRVTDSQGAEVHLPGFGVARRVLSPGTAFVMTDILSDTAAREPAFGVNNKLKLSRPAAAKTGTTTNWKDNWTLGYTRYIMAGVWSGNNDGTSMYDSPGSLGAAPIWNAFMEQAINDPAMRAVVDAPIAPALWEFEVPEGEAEFVEACPPGVQCRLKPGTSEEKILNGTARKGEYFTKEWLALTGDAGPLEDSSVPAGSAPVYVERQAPGEQVQTLRAGFCSLDIERPVYQLRSGGIVGLPGTYRWTPPVAEEAAANAAAIDDSEEEVPFFPVSLEEFTTAGLSEREQSRIADIYRTLDWGLANGGSVHLGRCDELRDGGSEMLAQEETGDFTFRLLVDFSVAQRIEAAPLPPEEPDEEEPSEEEQAIALADAQVDAENSDAEDAEEGDETPTPDATDEITPEAETTPEPESTPEPTATPAPVEAVAEAPAPDNSQFALASPVVNDEACPGNYVMGRVVNEQGGPVPGVYVLAVDQWGNRNTVVSKSDEDNYGKFDIPLNGGANTYTLTVIGDGGVPISPNITINHLQGDTAAPCHHVTLRATS